ncbi:MAG: universal stress protein [Allomuricauda sp.]|nr:MAG: universal stress protein [Allomuricauda sp.]
MKSIIVPVDFSEQSKYALQVAAAVASKGNAELLVLHMLELAPAILTESGYIPEVKMVHLMKMVERRFNEFLNEPYLKGLKVTPIIKHYKVFSEIEEVAKKHDSGLVVMGSHGTDGLREIFIGSNTERVVRNSEIPVLVVKGELKDFKPERMVFACDFTPENLDVIVEAVAFAKMLGAEIEMVYINTPGDAFLSNDAIYKRISKTMHLAKLGLEVTIYNDYTVENGILNYAEKNAADLIGIPTHGRKGLSHIFMGSIGEDVANHSTKPVVTFKI